MGHLPAPDKIFTARSRSEHLRNNPDKAIKMPQFSGNANLKTEKSPKKSLLYVFSPFIQYKYSGSAVLIKWYCLQRKECCRPLPGQYDIRRGRKAVDKKNRKNFAEKFAENARWLYIIALVPGVISTLSTARDMLLNKWTPTVQGFLRSASKGLLCESQVCSRGFVVA